MSNLGEVAQRADGRRTLDKGIEAYIEQLQKLAQEEGRMGDVVRILGGLLFFRFSNWA